MPRAKTWAELPAKRRQNILDWMQARCVEWRLYGPERIANDAAAAIALLRSSAKPARKPKGKRR